MVTTPKKTNYVLGDLCIKHEHENSGKSFRYNDGRCVGCRKDERTKSNQKKFKGVYASCTYPQTPIHPSKHTLGELCPKKHDHGNGRSLCFVSSGACVECYISVHAKPKSEDCYPMCPYPKLVIEPSRNILGLMCAKLHDFGNGQTLRFLKDYTCVQCSRDQPIFPSHKRPEKYRQYNRERSKKRYQQLKEENPRFGKEYYQANSERIRQATNERRRNSESRAKRAIEASRYRAKKASVHNVKWTVKEQEQRFLQFGNKCAYCGKAGNLTVDHFLPISRGGADCIGNIIPACGSCNFSKQSADPKDWYSSQVFYSKQKWNHILKILGLLSATYNQLPLF